MNWLVERTKGDVIIWIIVLFLSLVSLLAVYSSTETMAYKLRGGNFEYYIFKHFFLMAFGLAMMYFAHKINYKYYSRISQLAIVISGILLIITLFFGGSVNQAHRWLTLPGINLSFQTSDLAKLALIMYTARMLAKKQDVIDSFWKSTLPIMGASVIICFLILPANLSTAAVVFATNLLLMFIGRMNWKHITLIIIAGLFFLISGIYILHKIGGIGRVDTWVNRVENYFQGGEEKVFYQNQQANIAIATGGVFGKGPGNSVQKNFLPNPYADFIFAIIIEEYGLVGACILIFLYLLLLYRSIGIVLKSPRAFGALLAVGLAFSLVLQALINMGVAVHLFPVTGLTLPLVSMGGTSLWFTSIAFGIILSVSRDIEEKENLDAIPA